LAIGFSGTDNWLTGDSTKAIKPGAGIIDCAGSCGTAGQALLSNGSNAICWGTVSAAVACPTTLGTVYGYVGTNFKTDASIGIGLCSMLASSSVNTPTNAALGFATLRDLTSGGGNVAVGWRSLVTTTTGQSNVAVGAQAGEGADGTDNVFVGGQSGCLVVGNQNAFLGTFSGSTQVSGDANVAIGPNVALANTSGSCQLAIGFSAADNWLTGNSTKAIKPGAGIIDCANVCGTAGQVLMSDGANAICWGTAGGASDATPTLRGVLYGCSGTTTTGVGCDILTSLGAGACNTAVGCSVLSSIVNGGSNTAVGYKAGSSVITNGSFNVVMGSLALGNATGTGNISNNTAIGMRSLAALEAGSCNVAVGSCSMCSQTSGGSNVAIGYASLWNSTTGIGNVAIGFGSLLGSTTAGFNIGVGYASMQANTTGTCNIGIGICSHDNLDGGCNNVALGFRAGSNLSTGCYNVSIGDSVCLASATGSCQLAIGFSPTANWLTGDSTKAIKPGAGIIDCANVCGTANQVLVSTGANAVQWKAVNSALAVPNYGSFNSTVTQTVGTINVGQPVTLSTVAATNFSIVSSSQITAAVAGTYNVQISFQIISTAAGGGVVEIWFAKNGTPITNSNTRYSVKNANEEEVAALNLIETFAAGDNIQVFWASDNINMTLATLASTMGGPAIPSAIVTVVPVGA
jgi:hypothetical protein